MEHLLGVRYYAAFPGDALGLWFFLLRAHILAEYKVPKNGAQEQPLQLASAGIRCMTPGQPALSSLERMPLLTFIVLKINGQEHKAGVSRSEVSIESTHTLLHSLG